VIDTIIGAAVEAVAANDDRREWSREQAAARSSRAQDTRGPLPSLYRGVYFHADQEPFRRCVADREGSYTYEVVGGGSNLYHGTYQFRDGAWRRGLTYMMASESRRTKDGLRAEARALVDVPIHKWSRYWQDRAFYTALNYRGKWSGKSHWAGGRWSC
jgi:hypothetical protein